MMPIDLLLNQVKNLLSPFSNGLNEVFQSNSITFRGIRYLKNCCLVTGLKESLFQFLKIEHCYIINSVPYVVGKQMRTIAFDRHRYGFIVEESQNYNIVILDQNVEAHTLGLYKCTDQFIIIMKSKLLFEDEN